MQRLSSAVQQAGFHPPTTSKDSPRGPRWTLSQLSYGLLHRHLLKASPALPQPPLVQGSRRKGPFVWETQASDGRCDLPYHRDFSQVEMGNAVSDKWPQRGCEKWRLPRSENEPSPATAATQVHRTVKIIYIEASVFTDIMTLSGSGVGGAEKETKQVGRRRMRYVSAKRKRIRTALENVKKMEWDSSSAVRLGGKRQILIGFARRMQGRPLVKEKQPSATVQWREGREKIAALTDNHMGFRLQIDSLFNITEQLQ